MTVVHNPFDIDNLLAKGDYTMLAELRRRWKKRRDARKGHVTLKDIEKAWETDAEEDEHLWMESLKNISDNRVCRSERESSLDGSSNSGMIIPYDNGQYDRESSDMSSDESSWNVLPDKKIDEFEDIESCTKGKHVLLEDSIGFDSVHGVRLEDSLDESNGFLSVNPAHNRDPLEEDDLSEVMLVDQEAKTKELEDEQQGNSESLCDETSEFNTLHPNNTKEAEDSLDESSGFLSVNPAHNRDPLEEDDLSQVMLVDQEDKSKKVENEQQGNSESLWDETSEFNTLHPNNTKEPESWDSEAIKTNDSESLKEIEDDAFPYKSKQNEMDRDEVIIAQQTILKIKQSHTLTLKVPPDGSCFYHALSRYIRTRSKMTEIHILDLPSSVHPQEYDGRQARLSQTERTTSKFLRRWINEFIFNNTKLLLKLFNSVHLTDLQDLTNKKLVESKIQEDAKDSIKSNAWASTAQVFAFSLITMTPLCIWMESIDGLSYYTACNTEADLERVKDMETKNPSLYRELVAALPTQKIYNDNNVVINLFLNNGHYDTLILYEKK